MSGPVLAAHTWRTNAELIADVARVGHIRPDDAVLDVTYGRGIFWKHFRPTNFTFHDKAIDGVDFRALPYPGRSFDVVVYDPPYVSVGGRKTSTLGKAPDGKPGSDFHDRYGLVDAPNSPAALQALINEGLSECARVSRRFVIVKVQKYISSGHLWNGTYETEKHAIETLGMKTYDQFEHIAGVRPQPSGRRQLHARRNHSTLFVFSVPRVPKNQAA